MIERVHKKLGESQGATSQVAPDPSEAAEGKGRSRRILRKRLLRAKRERASDTLESSDPRAFKKDRFGRQEDELEDSRPGETPLVVDDLEDQEGMAEEPTSVWHSNTPRRLRRMFISFAIFVGIPILVASVYFYGFATDQYASRAQFAIRSAGANSGTAATGGLLSLAGATASMGDMYIVREYVSSLQVLKDLQPHIDIRKIYSKPSADWLARLDPTISDEELLKYWNRMVTVNYDITTGISELQVVAFTAEESKLIADKVLKLSEDLVNRISERARNDALKLARAEVDSAYVRVIKSIDAIEAYAELSGVLPTPDVGANATQITSGLEAKRVALRQELNTQLRTQPRGAPNIRLLEEQLAAVEALLKEEEQASTATKTGEASPIKVMTATAKLQLERQFSEKAYLAALSAQESAQMETLRQAQYLESFVRPQLASYAEFPQRLNNVVITGLCAVLLWAIGSLAVAATLEHL